MRCSFTLKNPPCRGTCVKIISKSLKMRIIPAIDIIDGKCVRLTQGDYAQKKIYNENPLEVAQEFENAGLKFLHLVDLDGAKAGKVVNWKVVESICKETNLDVDFGGGIKTEEQIKQLFDCGVKQVNLGSIAVKDPNMVTGWIKKFTSEKIILSADVKNEMIAISGWQESAAIPITTFLNDYVKNGIRICDLHRHQCRWNADWS